MQASGRVSDKQFRTVVRAWAKQSAAVEKETVQALAEDFIRIVVSRSPQDTRRYVSAWIEAGNAAGVSNFSYLPLRRSKHADTLLLRLERQLIELLRKVEIADKAAKFWEDTYTRRYGRTARKDRWERDCARKRDKALKRAAKLQVVVEFASEQIRKFKDGQAGELVIWGKSDAKDTAKRRYASVRDKVYGGRGTWKRAGHRTFLELKNLEPHASIVESRVGVVREALRSVEGLGLRRVEPRVVKLIGGLGTRV